MGIIELLEQNGIKLPLMISGFAGGLASIDRKEQISYFAKFISLIGGSFSANYLTPVISDWMTLKETSMFGLSFLVGYGGLKFIEITYQKLSRLQPGFREKNEDETKNENN